MNKTSIDTNLNQNGAQKKETDNLFERGAGKKTVLKRSASDMENASHETNEQQKATAGSSKRISLVLFSGGIDSTHALMDLLKNTDDIVLAHHVHMINKEQRHEAEAKACREIVSWCGEHLREFYYTESVVDRRKFKACGLDVMTVVFEGGIAASNYLLDTGRHVDRYFLGYNQEEFDALDNAAAKASPDGKSRLEHIKAAMAAQCFPNQPPEYVRPNIKPKSTFVKELGPELTALCWTCRHPIKTKAGFEECGKCATCEQMNKIREDLDG